MWMISKKTEEPKETTAIYNVHVTRIYTVHQFCHDRDIRQQYTSHDMQEPLHIYVRSLRWKVKVWLMTKPPRPHLSHLPSWGGCRMANYNPLISGRNPHGIFNDELLVFPWMWLHMLARHSWLDSTVLCFMLWTSQPNWVCECWWYDKRTSMGLGRSM